jgi:hypothetical protein
MVFYLPQLRSSWKKVIQVTAPPSRIFARTVPAHPSPIEYDFDSPANSTRGFRFPIPNRLQHFHDHSDVDMLNRYLAEYG